MSILSTMHYFDISTTRSITITVLDSIESMLHEHLLPNSILKHVTYLYIKAVTFEFLRLPRH